MAGGERVMLALGRLGESGEAAGRSDRRELIAAAGDKLVRVRLIGRVPDQPVFRALKNAMERQRQLDGAEVRGEVPAAFGDRLDDHIATVAGHFGYFLVAEGIEIAR